MPVVASVINPLVTWILDFEFLGSGPQCKLNLKVLQGMETYDILPYLRTHKFAIISLLLILLLRKRENSRDVVYKFFAKYRMHEHLGQIVLVSIWLRMVLTQIKSCIQKILSLPTKYQQLSGKYKLDTHGYIL
jgi:hypothetical protein